MNGICISVMPLAEFGLAGQRGRDLHAWNVETLGESGFRHPICADLPLLPTNTVGYLDTGRRRSGTRIE